MIQLIHFENGLKSFETDEEFITFTQLIFKENEEDEEEKYMLIEPETVKECKEYVETYCGNFELVS